MGKLLLSFSKVVFKRFNTLVLSLGYALRKLGFIPVRILEVNRTAFLVHQHLKPFIVSYDTAFSNEYAYLDYAQKTRKLKVMMLGLRGFPNVQGGIETHVENLAPRLVKHGCVLEVIVRSGYQNEENASSWNGVAFTKIWAPRSKGFEALVHTFLGVLYAGIKRPDVLHIHAIGPAIMTPLAKLLGLKVVVTHHGPDYDRQKWGYIAKQVLRIGEYFGMRFSDGRLVISNVIKDLVQKKHIVTSKLIPNGVNLPSLDAPVDLLAPFGLHAGQYVLLVSRLVPEKRHLDLIAAFNHANMKGYKLAIVGASDHPDAYILKLMEEAAKNPNIKLLGFQTGMTLKALYSHAGLFVLPSSHEGLSISLLEALSFGLPVLASNIPANLELHLEAERYFRLGDVDELARKMKLILSQPHTVAHRDALRHWVQTQFNWNEIALKTVAEYRNVVRSSRSLFF